MGKSNLIWVFVVIVAVVVLYGKGTGTLSVKPPTTLCTTPSSCQALPQFYYCDWYSFAGTTYISCSCEDGYVESGSNCVKEGTTTCTLNDVICEGYGYLKICRDNAYISIGRCSENSVDLNNKCIASKASAVNGFTDLEDVCETKNIGACNFDSECDSGEECIDNKCVHIDWYCIDFYLQCKGFPDSVKPTTQRCYGTETLCKERIPKCGDGICDDVYEDKTKCASDCGTTIIPKVTCYWCIDKEKSIVNQGEYASCSEASLTASTNKTLIEATCKPTTTTPAYPEEKKDYSSLWWILGGILGFILILKLMKKEK